MIARLRLRSPLLTALREHGVAEVSDVEMAVLEIDGSISVVPVGGSTSRSKKPIKFLRHQLGYVVRLDGNSNS